MSLKTVYKTINKFICTTIQKLLAVLEPFFQKVLEPFFQKVINLFQKLHRKCQDLYKDLYTRLKTRAAHTPPHTKHARQLQVSCFILAALLLVSTTFLTGLLLEKKQEAPELTLAQDLFEPVFDLPINASHLTIEDMDDLDIHIHIAEEDVAALSKMVWGEARGMQGFTAASGRYVSNTEQMAACIWTVLNRVDADYADSTIIGVVTAKNQYVGYRPSNPVDPEIANLARDCMIRWKLEKALAKKGISLDTGRVLPKPDGDNLWCWFKASSDYHTNEFRATYETEEVYDWSLDTPYEEDIVVEE